jgi:hypothetical protein
VDLRILRRTDQGVDHVLPLHPPLRQRVLTVPHALRTRLAYDRELLSRVRRLFVNAVLSFYRRGDVTCVFTKGESRAAR